MRESFVNEYDVKHALKTEVTCSFPQRQPGISSPNFTLKTIDLKKVLRILFVDDILVDNKIFF